MISGTLKNRIDHSKQNLMSAKQSTTFKKIFTSASCYKNTLFVAAQGHLKDDLIYTFIQVPL